MLTLQKYYSKFNSECPRPILANSLPYSGRG
jgi:hypothetical protein